MELRINSDYADLSLELLLNKVQILINFWAPPKKMSNKKKQLQIKPWLTKGLLKSIEVKNRLYKKICQTKDLLKRQQLKDTVKKYKTNLL